MDFSYWWLWVLLLGEWAIRLGMVAVVLLRRNARSSTSLAWIALILLVPVLGVVAYLVLGETRLGRLRMRRHAEIAAAIESPETKPPPSREALASGPSGAYRRIALLSESFGAPVAVGGNRLRLIGDTDVVIQRMVEDIDAAESHCHLLSYIYLDDHSGQRIGSALVRAAERGVASRVLVDGVGSYRFLRSKLCATMRAGGVEVVEALQANIWRLLLRRVDLRNHRKITVVDGRVGYTGSQNIANAEFAPKARYAPWVDCMVRAEGPIVRDLQTLFVEDWFLDSGNSLAELLSEPVPFHEDGVPAQLIATGPNSPPEAVRELFQAAMQFAQRELVLTTPYFVPDEATVLAMAASSRRGVDVVLVVPKRNDSRVVGLASRAFYEPLLRAGVRILEYRDGLLHAKTMTVDRELAMVTSANLDRRSFDLNFEAGLLIYDSDFASTLRFLQNEYIGASDTVDPGRWMSRPNHERIAQNAAGLLAPLL